MTVFDRIREKNKVIAFLVRLQNSSFYPIFFAIICAMKKFATINGEAVPYANASIWDRRMVSGASPMQIKSFFPYVGRGCIEHDTVSHDATNKLINKCAKKSLVEKILGWFDV
jgi:hypothetical protein